MALLWLEGFEADNNFTDYARKYEFFSADLLNGVGGRWQGTGLTFRNSPGVEFRTINLGNKADAVMGCNFKLTNGTNVGEQLLFRLLDATNEQISLYWLTDANGAVKFRVKRGSTTIATTTNAWNAGFWILVEWKVILDTNGGNGSVEVRVNSVSELLVQNIDTTNNASLVWNRAYLALSTPSTFSANATADDWYVLDLTGSAPTNDWLGEITIEKFTPSGNGNRNQWTAVGAANSFQCVNEIGATPVNDDTTYLFVWTSDDDKVELFAMSDLTTIVAPIYGVLLEYDLRMDNGGLDHFCTIFRSGGGTEATGATKTINQTASYKRYIDILEQDPVAAAAWTVANFNAMQMGIKSLA